MNIKVRDKYTLIDDEDYNLIKDKTLDLFYKYVCVNIKIDGKWTKISLHRFILNAPKGMQVDHIDRNPLNNQKSNLRLCTVSQNHANKTKQKNNKSGYKGVFWRKDREKWCALIRVNKKRYWLGSFKTPLLASLAYQKAAIKYYGNFASF